MQTVLLALSTVILTVLARPLIEGSKNIEGSTVQGDAIKLKIGLFLIGIIICLLGGALLVVYGQWKSVTIAGRQYVSLRWISIIAIEKLAGVSRIGMASIENEYKAFSEKKPFYFPFKDVNDLNNLKLNPLVRTRGWSSMLNVISLWQIIGWIIIVVGILVLVSVFFV